MRIISGSHKNRPFKAPKGSITRPTSGMLREALFNVCQNYIEGAFFLDLFAGSGAMGLEALSRGAARAVFIDNSRESIQCIQNNLRDLGFEQVSEVLFGNVFDQLSLLEKKGRQFDLIYADPPYDTIGRYQGTPMAYGEIVLRMIDAGSLLKQGGMLFIEDSRRSQPKIEGLNHLELHSSRRMGRSTLQQYGIKSLDLQS